MEAFEKSHWEMTTSKFKPTPPWNLTQILAFPSNWTAPSHFTILPLPVDLNGHLPVHIYFLGADSTGFSRKLPLSGPTVFLFFPLTINPNPSPVDLTQPHRQIRFSRNLLHLGFSPFCKPTLTIDIHRHCSMEFEIVFNRLFWEKWTMAEFVSCCSDVQDFAFVSEFWTRRTIVFIIYLLGVCFLSMSDLVARTGRHQQRYDAGCRLIAGYIPTNIF